MALRILLVTLFSVGSIVKMVFWAIFGEAEDKPFDHGTVTAVTGHILFAVYNWIIIIILINMLIAMMARSYDIIKVCRMF